MAEFLVPLNINKFDMKDYLFHAYGIPALSIRSSIQQLSIERKNDGAYHRPRSVKRMIVEMGPSQRGGPFVWPEEITNLEPWDKQLYDDAQRANEQAQQDFNRYGSKTRRKDLKSVKEQAEALLRDKEGWQPSWVQRSDTAGQQLGVGTPLEIREQLGSETL